MMHLSRALKDRVLCMVTLFLRFFLKFNFALLFSYHPIVSLIQEKTHAFLLEDMIASVTWLPSVPLLEMLGDHVSFIRAFHYFFIFILFIIIIYIFFLERLFKIGLT